IDSLFESIPWVDVQVLNIVASLTLTAPTLPPLTIPTISQLKKILIEKIESNKSIHRSNEQRNLYKALVDAYECDKIILDTYGDIVMLKRRRDDADKDEEPSAGSDQGSKRRREGKEPESTSALKEKATKTTGKSTQGSKSHQKTASESAPAEEPMQTTQDLKEPSHQEFETAIYESNQPWISDLAKKADFSSSFNELMDTPVDFLAFLMNRLKVDTLTLELIAGPTYKLMKGSCKSLVELEFSLEKVYKATTDHLDWNNPKGPQYLHNMLKPLTLIPNSRGHRVIPFDHFITTTSSIYVAVPSVVNLLGISHWGRKRQQFYGFIVNMKSARDVYSKRRIIAVIELQIVEWHNYKHLDWITVRKDNDKLYKFKEDPRRERAQMNEFENVFGQDKDANCNMIFSLISATRSTYVYLGGSIPVNAATLPNAHLPTDPFMPDLEDTANTKIFSDAYDDEVEGAEADFNNL
nr:hypothetical protein [Tanacetum cinerariifolium]